jgi:hypothetical protein
MSDETVTARIQGCPSCGYDDASPEHRAHPRVLGLAFIAGVANGLLVTKTDHVPDFMASFCLRHQRTAVALLGQMAMANGLDPNEWLTSLGAGPPDPDPGEVH